MRPLLPHLPLRAKLALSCALLAGTCLLGACDEHSPQEVPESYGHGSSHSDSYKTHQTDSHPNSESFSDTRGINAGKSQEPGGEHHAAPDASPSPHQEDRFGLPGGRTQ